MSGKYGFAAMGISDSEIEAEIAGDAEVDAGLNKFMAGEVVPYWKSQSPVLSGEYAGDVYVIKKAHGGQGQVGDNDWKAHFVEFGTGGTTPTPEFAPGAKTAAHFGGTLDAKSHGHSDKDKHKDKAGKRKGKRK